jgi:hypothetical protein
LCIEAAGETEEIVVELMTRPEPWVVGELTGMQRKGLIKANYSNNNNK